MTRTTSRYLLLVTRSFSTSVIRSHQLQYNHAQITIDLGTSSHQKKCAALWLQKVTRAALFSFLRWTTESSLCSPVVTHLALTLVRLATMASKSQLFVIAQWNRVTREMCKETGWLQAPAFRRCHFTQKMHALLLMPMLSGNSHQITGTSGGLFLWSLEDSSTSLAEWWSNLLFSLSVLLWSLSLCSFYFTPCSCLMKPQHGFTGWSLLFALWLVLLAAII